MANRLSRDSILIRALDLVDSPRLDEKDRPSSTIVAGALSIGWLQDALDLAHNLYPMSGLLKSATFNITTGTDTYTITTVASDFVLDFKDGIVLPDDKGRLRRSAFNKLLDYPTSTNSRAKPTRYGIQNGLLVLRPVPNEAFNSTTLYYYSLPSTLAAGTVPAFPVDLILVEYVHLRGKEWLREVQPGTAEAYLISATARLQKAGLGSEAEIDDVIGLDPHAFPGGGPAHENAEWFTRVTA